MTKMGCSCKTGAEHLYSCCPDCLESYRDKDPDAVRVWEKAAIGHPLYAIRDCTHRVIGFLYVDCGRQRFPDRGYYVIPHSHGLAEAICGDTLEEATHTLSALKCTIERLLS